MGVDRVVVVSNSKSGRGGASGFAGGVCAAIGRSGREAVMVETGCGGAGGGAGSAGGAGGGGSLAEAIEAAIQKPSKVSSGAGSKSGTHRSVNAAPSGGVGPVGVSGVPGGGEARTARAIVVCGGDGTVHAVLEVAHATGIPIYHMPMGTENLFAREFGMTRGVDALIDALDGESDQRVDLARCNGELLALMCSVGPDAGVIHRLDAARTGPITHRSYTRHILAELAHPRPSTVRIEIDGREVVRESTGMVVVANSRQYAMRIDPASGADMRDGELDVVFLPARSRVRMVSWLVLARARALGMGGSGAVCARGKRIVIQNRSGPFVYQVDGEARGNGTERAVEIEVVPGGLGVVGGNGKVESGKRRA